MFNSEQVNSIIWKSWRFSSSFIYLTSSKSIRWKAIENVILVWVSLAWAITDIYNHSVIVLLICSVRCPLIMSSYHSYGVSTNRWSVLLLFLIYCCHLNNDFPSRRPSDKLERSISSVSHSATPGNTALEFQERTVFLLEHFWPELLTGYCHISFFYWRRQHEITGPIKNDRWFGICRLQWQGINHQIAGLVPRLPVPGTNP